MWWPRLRVQAGEPADADFIGGLLPRREAGGDRRFTTGMAAADHDHVEGFGGGSGAAHDFLIRRHRRMMWLRKQLGLNSQHSVQIGVVDSDLGVVIDVSEDEMSVEFSCFEGEFIFANESITPLGLEVKNLILSA